MSVGNKYTDSRFHSLTTVQRELFQHEFILWNDCGPNYHRPAVSFATLSAPLAGESRYIEEMCVTLRYRPIGAYPNTRFVVLGCSGHTACGIRPSHSAAGVDPMPVAGSGVVIPPMSQLPYYPDDPSTLWSCFSGSDTSGSIWRAWAPRSHNSPCRQHCTRPHTDNILRKTERTSSSTGLRHNYTMKCARGLSPHLSPPGSNSLG